jgi:4-amino-4-deoxy-L-arabinose transferase-like glycosyltransferase
MKFQLKFSPSPIFWLGVILAAALGWKALLLALNAVPFNADEAVVALMARHILQGARPIFFYGQAYMGSLDAILVAVGFWLFGQQVWVIRLVQALLYAGLIVTTIGLGKEAYGSWRVGFLGAVLMIIPTVNVTLYTTASLGGYGEALLIGNLILYTGLRIVNQIRSGSQRLAGWAPWLLWGFLMGLGLWANGLTLIYSAPMTLGVGILFLRRRKQIPGRDWARAFGIVVAGFLIGSAPWWIFAFSQGLGGLVTELLGGAVAVEKDPWVVQTFNHLVSFVLLGGTAIFGFRPPWEVRWLGLPLLPFAMFAWAAIIAVLARQFKQATDQNPGRWLMLGVALTLMAGFIFTSFGVDPSGRYFVPFVVPLSLSAADAISRMTSKRIWQAVFFGVLLVYQGWGTLDCATRNPPGITTQFNAVTQVDMRYQEDLIQFLRSEGETRGYTNYWVAYPTAFLSGEELIFAPRLPYHEDLRYTARDNRYAPYAAQVLAAPRVAYITTHNPNLDQKLTEGFQRLGIAWQERRIGDYRVYYRLSRVVHPDELALGLVQ